MYDCKSQSAILLNIQQTRPYTKRNEFRKVFHMCCNIYMLAYTVLKWAKDGKITL